MLRYHSALRRRASPVFAALVLILPAAAAAQSTLDNDPDALPQYANSVLHVPAPDSINLYNGQLTIPIPIGPSYPLGPKLKLQLLLTYSSRGPDYSRGGPPPGEPVTLMAGDPALGIGWNFTLGAIKMTASSFPLTQALTYFAPDGSQHVLNPLGNGYFKTLDTTQYYVHSLGTAGYEMWDGDGNRYVLGRKVGMDANPVFNNDDPFNAFVHEFGRGRDGWYLTSLRDPFGNGFDVTYRTGDGPCWVSPYCAPPDPPVTTGGIRCPPGVSSWVPAAISLTSGATITVDVDTAKGGTIKSFTFPVAVGQSQTTATWNLIHDSAQSSQWTGCGKTITSTVYKLTDIQLPASAGSYHFDYSTCTWLLLSRMTLPTTGTIDYTWGGYSFYHGRPSHCGVTPGAPAPGHAVLVSQTCGGARASSSGVSCSDPEAAFLDVGTIGLVSRTETDPVSGTSGTTTYTQYAFPYGEQGTYSPGFYNSQSLTVVVFPPDNDGKVRSKSVLFHSGPNGTLASPGDRIGMSLREAHYDFMVPRYDTVNQPACSSNDYLFCPNHAFKVQQRAYEYDDMAGQKGNARLQAETTYYGATASSGACTTCLYHTVAFTNPTGTWEGNGRHYGAETHSGNLGNDYRQVVTTWTPVATPWFPNLLSKRVTTDSTGSLNEYFDYDTGAQADGFLRGTMIWDAGRSRIFGDCRYRTTSQGLLDTHGNVASRYTGTWDNWTWEPSSNQCFISLPGPLSWGGWPGNGNVFATDYTYSNGQKLTARPVNGSSPGAWLKYDVTRDSQTGWITAMRDSAGQQTTYLYDALGRPTSITPPGEVATVVTYDSTTQTTAQRNGGADSSTWTRFQYDGSGRTIRELRLMPSGSYAKRFTRFDARGNAYFQSEWVPESTAETLTSSVAATCVFKEGNLATNVPASAPGLYRACFDPFGRAQVLTGASYSSQVTVSRTDARPAMTTSYYSDTNETATTACVNGALVSTTPHCSGGSDATTTTLKDAYGRATSVTEPTGDVTTYGYDVLGKLSSVAQGIQSRTFDYDRFGFLRREVTPEKGTVTYDSIGSVGNVLQETQPGNMVVSRTFDYAGRLTSVSTNEGRTYVANTYDQSGHGSADGKLTTAVATNWALATASTVTDSFTYSGLGGRLSSKTESLSGSASLSTTQTFGYNSLGLLSSHGHPRAAGDAPFTVSFTFGAGLPVSELVNGSTVVSGITYQPSGALASYTTNNGAGHAVVTTIAQDGNLPRPSRISTSGATTNFDSGTYLYDGAGNVRAAGADTFVHDLRSRLTGANIFKYDGTSHPETFQYDRYGNMTFRTIDGSGVTFPSINPATNRFDTMTYDPRGNLTLYGASSYAYDGLSRQTSFQVTGTMDERYLYDAAGERMARVVPGTTTVSGGYFYNLPPCRLFDSRANGPALPANGTRTVLAWNLCGIPSTATTLAANVTSVDIPTSGFLRAYPAGLASPPLAWVNAFRLGQATATQAFISINGPTPGSFNLFGDFPSGSVNAIVDVDGYFVQTTTTTPDSYTLTYRDVQNHPATKYTLAGGVSSIQRDYVYLGDQLVATWQPSGGYSFYVTDHLGTPRLVTDTNATTTTRAKVRAFGLPLEGTLPEGPEFAAMEKDTSSQNHYDHARYYGSWLGRFNSPDLLGGHPGDPQSWNRYTYARNNPLKYVDPDGRVIAYAESFRTAVRTDPIFRGGFLAWKATPSGMDQWRRMAGDENTTYTLEVGRARAFVGPLKTQEVEGMTLPVPRVTDVNSKGMLDLPAVTSTINAPSLEEHYAADPARASNEIAKALFHEVAHALDLGSGEKTLGEALRAERFFDTNTEPRLRRFTEELGKVFLPVKLYPLE